MTDFETGRPNVVWSDILAVQFEFLFLFQGLKIE